VDVTAPVARISAPPRKRRSRRASWRTLRGTVRDASPSSGIKRVQVAATSRRAGRCRSLGRNGFASARCGARTRWVSATVNGTRWQLRLKGLRRGAVRFRVRALDNAGNLQKPASVLKIRLKR
jgi:5'-nucleotidase